MTTFLKIVIVAATLSAGAVSANAGLMIDATQGPITIVVDGGR